MRTWTEPSVESISALMLQLHEVPLIPTKWPHVLEQFTQLLDLPAMTIQHFDYRRQSQRFAISVGIDPATLSDYERHFAKVDPYWLSFLRNPFDRFMHGEEICPRSELFETEFYGDFLARHDEPVGVLTAEVRGWRKRHLRAISTYQRLTDPVPSAKVVQLIQLFRPHFDHCLGLQERLGQLTREKHSLETALNGLEDAIILLDDRGSALFVSQKAEALLNANTGVRMCCGRLDAVQSPKGPSLQDSIARALSLLRRARPDLIKPVRIEAPDGTVLTVRITPLPASSSHVLPISPPARAAVLLQFDQRSTVAQTLETMLRTVYRLTPAEIRIALQLHQGGSLQECAQSNATSVHTVRTQLKAVFQKLGVRRQVGLLTLLNELARSSSAHCT